MAYRVNWTEIAFEDLEGVEKYISRNSPYYAAVFIREVREASRSLSHFPLRGRIVPELSDNTIRELIVRNYRLIYKIQESDVYNRVCPWLS
jgi:toxin ParE1/3/4